tara:strand:- start:276 stop:1364 length:1089 start_codon:yes stop_codon:yes gene_type:complete
MTNDNLYQQPKLFVDGKEILYDFSGSLSFSGNSQINKLRIKIPQVDFQFNALYGKSVELYLDLGSQSSIPIFRGFVRDINPSDKMVSLLAHDVRCLLTGKLGAKLQLTDTDNYDGKTVAQFLYEFITDQINVSDTHIGLDMLKDSDPPAYMTGVRGKDLDVYNVAREQLKKAVSYPIQDISDSDSLIDLMSPLSFSIGVYEGSNNSNITIVKDKPIEIHDTSNDTIPPYILSFADGIVSYTNKKRQAPNTVFYENGSFEYTNRPDGVLVTNINDTGDRAENRNLALEQILLEQQSTEEIVISVSKCYDIGIGNTVYLDVEDEDIRGEHRVQAKQISFGTKMDCVLTLNKKPVVLSDYIQRQQ